MVQIYRPGQPNWELIKWKFQDFSATQILREINFGHFEAQKVPKRSSDLNFWKFMTFSSMIFTKN